MSFLFRVLPPLTRSSSRALSTAASAAAPKVNYVVPPAAIKSFHERGYAVLPNFLSEEEILPIEKIYDRFMSGELAGPGKDFCDMSQSWDAIKNVHPDNWNIVNAMLPRKYHWPLQENIYELRAANVATQLFPEVNMVYDYCQLLNKRPQKKAAIFAWHQDMVRCHSGRASWVCRAARFPPPHPLFFAC